MIFLGIVVAGVGAWMFGGWGAMMVLLSVIAAAGSSVPVESIEPDDGD